MRLPLQERVGVVPGPELLEDGARRQDVCVGEALADDLHSDRQVVVGEPGRDRRCGMAREVDEVRQAPADERVHVHARDLARTDRVPVVCVRDRDVGHRRRHEQVIVGEHALDRVVDLGSHSLVAHEVGQCEAVALLDPG